MFYFRIPLELILNKVSKIINIYSRNQLFHRSAIDLKIAVVALIHCEIPCSLEDSSPNGVLFNLDVFVRRKLLDIRGGGVGSGQVCQPALVRCVRHGLVPLGLSSVQSS